MIINSPNKGSNEDGIFIALAAVSILVLSTFFMVITVNNHMVRVARQQLQLSADDICSALLQGNLVLHRDVALSFGRQVIRKKLSYFTDGNATLVSATLTEPTFPPGEVNFFDPIPSLDLEAYLSTGTTNYDGIPFTSLGINTGCGDLCQFRSNVTHPNHRNSSDFSRFPPTFWNNIEHAGNSVACELEASVRQILRDPVTINTVSAGWKRYIGDWSQYIPMSQYVTAVRKPDQVPSFVLAISTHMTTHLDDPRSEFPGSANPVPAASGWRAIDASRYNPKGRKFFANFSQHQANSVSGSIGEFKGNSRWRTWDQPVCVDKNGNETLPVLPDGTQLGLLEMEGEISCAKAESFQCITDPDHDLYESVGPNIGQKTVPRYCISDTGDTSAEQMIAACMNPATLARNAYAASFLEIAARHGHLRSATEVVLVGTKPFSLPSGNLQGKGSGSPTVVVPLGSDLLKEQYSLPYVELGTIEYDSAFTASVYKDSYENLLKNQLRYCFHLYRESAFFGPPIERFNSDEYFHEKNASFEDPDEYSHRSTISGVTATNTWDQRCDNLKCTYDDALNAVELVSMLGTTQICPYEARRPFLGDKDGMLCAKPNVDNDRSSPGVKDAFPDLVALMKYVSSARPNSNLVLVTHLLYEELDSSTYLAELRAATAGFQGRVFIIYIPFRKKDWEESLTRLDKLKENLNADKSDSPNRVISVLPQPQASPGMLGHSSSFDAGQIASFWTDNLFDDMNQQFFIVHRVIDIFSKGLTRSERRM